MPIFPRDPTSIKPVEDTRRSSKVVLYHSTSRKNADSILREGFRDRTDYYLTGSLHTGVWLSDTPLDENEGANSEVLLRLELHEATIAPFEWVEDGKSYREFLIPATVVNSVPCAEESKNARLGE